MARVYGKDGRDGDGPLGTPTTITTATWRQTAPGQIRAATMEDVKRLDLKALRLAVHGWWLGNPLVYKPGVANLTAVAHELAAAGAAAGTLVLSDGPADSASASAGAILNGKPIPHVSINAILILRPPLPRSLLGSTAARAVADVAQAALGCPCAVQRRWEVVLHDVPCAQHFCRVSAHRYEDVALLQLHLALDQLWTTAEDGAGPLASALFARPDWREVFLARVLHTLDGRLRAARVA
ncbi:MAG: hypothetical protein ABI068_16425 [Ktedonobacterales bacterium]